MTGAPRTFRIPRRPLRHVLGVLALACAALLFRLYSMDLRGIWPVLVWVGWGLFAGLLLAFVFGRSTEVTADGIAVRGVLRVRRYPWPEIADLREDEYTALLGRSVVPVAVLYDASMRPVMLPNVNGRQLGGAEALRSELEKLRAAWEVGRGPAWRPPPLSLGS